jgi:hypothetical protein
LAAKVIRSQLARHLRREHGNVTRPKIKAPFAVGATGTRRYETRSKGPPALTAVQLANTGQSFGRVLLSSQVQALELLSGVFLDSQTLTSFLTSPKKILAC